MSNESPLHHPAASSPAEVSPNPDLCIIISDATFQKIAQYHANLAYGRKQPGKRLAALLSQGKGWFEYSSTEFIDLLYNSKNPLLFAEGDPNIAEWNETEIEILGDISSSINALVRGNGAREPGPIPYVNYNPPIDARLLFVNGPLQKSAIGETPDFKELWKSESGRLELDVRAFYRMMERRLLPIFQHANTLGEAQGKNVFITVPGLGCGEFAPNGKGGQDYLRIKNDLKSALKMAVQGILDQHIKDLPKLSAVYLDTWSHDNNEEMIIPIVNSSSDDLHRGHTCTLYIKHGSNSAHPHSQLEHPSQYDNKYTNCLFMTVVAADHLAWPGNDMYNLSPKTDEGAKANATNAIPQVLRDSIHKMSDEEVIKAGQNLVKFLFSRAASAKFNDGALIIKYYNTWFKNIVINGNNAIDMDPFAAGIALLKLNADDYRKILLNAVQDDYDETHHRSYPKSNHLSVNSETHKVTIKGLHWEELVKLTGIHLDVRNHIYVLNERNQLSLLEPKKLPVRFESRPTKSYEQCVQQEPAAIQPAQSSWLGSLSSVFSSEPPKNVEPAKSKKIKCHITAQMASSLYLHANDIHMLTDAEKLLSAPEGQLLCAILSKMGEVKLHTPLPKSGFDVTVGEEVWQIVVGIDKQQRVIFDRSLTDLMNAHLFNVNSSTQLTAFCQRYERQLLNRNNLLADVWEQVKSVFEERKLTSKFDGFKRLIIDEAQRLRALSDPSAAAALAQPLQAPLLAASAAVSSSALTTPTSAVISPAAAAAASPAVLAVAITSPANAAASRGIFAESPASTSLASVDRSAAAAAQSGAGLSNQSQAKRTFTRFNVPNIMYAPTVEIAESPAASPASVDRSAAAAAKSDTDLSNQRQAKR